MFLGTHAPKLDEKGRLFLPAKYRDELSGGVVITKGQERCLYVFPTDEFGRMAEALRTAPVTLARVSRAGRRCFMPGRCGACAFPASPRVNWHPVERRGARRRKRCLR